MEEQPAPCFNGPTANTQINHQKKKEEKRKNGSFISDYFLSVSMFIVSAHVGSVECIAVVIKANYGPYS